MISGCAALSGHCPFTSKKRINIFPPGNEKGGERKGEEGQATRSESASLLPLTSKRPASVHCGVARNFNRPRSMLNPISRPVKSEPVQLRSIGRSDAAQVVSTARGDSDNRSRSRSADEESSGGGRLGSASHLQLTKVTKTLVPPSCPGRMCLALTYHRNSSTAQCGLWPSRACRARIDWSGKTDCDPVSMLVQRLSRFQLRACRYLTKADECGAAESAD